MKYQHHSWYFIDGYVYVHSQCVSNQWIAIHKALIWFDYFTNWMEYLSSIPYIW